MKTSAGVVDFLCMSLHLCILGGHIIHYFTMQSRNAIWKLTS